MCLAISFLEKKNLSDEKTMLYLAKFLVRFVLIGFCVKTKQYVKRHFKMSALKKLIPLADRVLVQKMVAETKTKGGLFLPETSKSKVCPLQQRPLFEL